jgi:hypothetical protein
MSAPLTEPIIQQALLFCQAKNEVGMNENRELFLTYTRKLKAGMPVGKCQIVSFILTDTKPELSALGLAKSCQCHHQESLSDAPLDSSL